MVASWIETTHLPVRELRKRFTKSEMAIAAWRSSEVAFNMQQRTGQPQPSLPNNFGPVPEQESRLAEIEARLGPTAWKIVDEKGNVDLRRVTGSEALKFLSAMGMNVAVQPPRT